MRIMQSPPPCGPVCDICFNPARGGKRGERNTTKAHSPSKKMSSSSTEHINTVYRAGLSICQCPSPHSTAAARMWSVQISSWIFLIHISTMLVQAMYVHFNLSDHSFINLSVRSDQSIINPLTVDQIGHSSIVTIDQISWSSILTMDQISHSLILTVDQISYSLILTIV
jgi:hypothetical protein